jgi:hypothetical protein
MPKVGSLSGRVKKVPSTLADPNRYEFLDLQNAEPDLGVPSANGYVLTSNTDGNRTWFDSTSLLGFTGSQGFTGSRGFTGSQGFTGSRGFTGSQGFSGSLKASQGPLVLRVAKVSQDRKVTRALPVHRALQDPKVISVSLVLRVI